MPKSRPDFDLDCLIVFPDCIIVFLDCLIVSLDRLMVFQFSFPRGSARAEDAQGTPTQGHISPSILECTKKIDATNQPRFMRVRDPRGVCTRRGGGAAEEALLARK